MAFMKYPAWQKEWEQLLKREKQYVARHLKPRQPLLGDTLTDKIPAGLQATLDKAFYKGFELVFDKGVGVIEKTYHKKERQDAYKVRRYAAGLRKDKKSIRAFARKAHSHNRKNLLLSGAEGVGLGLLGIGLPDIPLFVGLMLKSIYEVALSFGFGYDSPEEQYFILRLIETGLYSGSQMEEQDAAINTLIFNMHRGAGVELPLKDQTRQTAAALSQEMLILKFIQGIPLAGVVGGVSNLVFLKQITDYATLKYRRRFLMRLREDNTSSI